MTATYSLTGGLSTFLEPYHDLFQVQRLTASFDAAISGILSSGSTRIRQMARLSPTLGLISHAERRLRRLVHRQHRRSDLTPEALTTRLRQQAAVRLAGSSEVIVVLDGLDLRKPHSQRLEYLDTSSGHPAGLSPVHQGQPLPDERAEKTAHVTRITAEHLPLPIHG